jgi:hypothetical protein
MGLSVYMTIVITSRIRDKLALKHNVTPEDVEQCFANRNGEYIEDTRPAHKRKDGLVTYWFIAENHYGRKLKVAFVEENGNLYICTALDASPAVIRNYLKNGGKVI